MAFLIYFLIFIISALSGYKREEFPRFSARWSRLSYAPLLLVLYFGIKFGFLGFIGGLISFVVGQRIGSRLGKNYMSEKDIEILEQIPNIFEAPKETIPEADVEVVLYNMGGPKTNADVKDFQKHLFEDSRLIRFPLSFLLQKVFARTLIFFRLKAVEARYKEMREKEGGSPIYRSTENQTHALQEELKGRGTKLTVSYSFNYSRPFPEDTIKDLKARQKKYILPLSLYPHYSKATAGSNMFYLKQAAQAIYPELKFLQTPSYHLHNQYIEAFVKRIEEALKPGEKLDDFYLIFSAHGLPLYFQNEGDPYAYQISETTAKVLAQLNRTQNWTISFQSAVGPFEWLKPSTEEVIKALARRNIKKIIVVPIAFVGDHIETIIELDVEYRQIAEKLGVKDYRMSKAIESHPGFISALADTVFLSLNKTNDESQTSTINQPMFRSQV
jgi:ferrochelatase